jgi:diguanylate cyclase (GGDEF)-like protein
MEIVLRYLVSYKIDVIVTVLDLPDISGLKTVDKLKREYPMLPVIVLSEQAGSILAAKAVHEGARDYLLKNAINEAIFNRAIHYAVEKQKSDNDIELARKKAEDQTWGLKKTNEAIKLLYKELDEKNRKLEALDQLKSDFVSTVSHELRTPLAITKEGISLILDRILGDVNEKQHQILVTAKSNMDRLNRIINDLLDISKIEAGKLEIKMNASELNELITQVTSSFKINAEKAGLKIITELPEEPIDILMDTGRITQVLVNLIGNSMKFTEKGHIKIVLEDRVNEVLVKVEDTGKGMTPEEIQHVFDKFRQFGRQHGPGDKGTGLGMTISKQIVELHGGDMWVKSEEGNGTTCYFTIPKSTAEKCFQILDEHLECIRKTSDDEKPSLIVVQINNLKDITDQFGENAAKEAMASLHNVISENVTRTGDVLLQCLPDKIFGLLPRTNIAGANIVCGKIMEAINRTRIIYGGNKMTLNVLFGFSQYMTDGNTAEELVQAAEEQLHRGKRILVVDDHPQIVRILSCRLEEKERFQCIKAYNGEEALKKAREQLPDLIICDIVMPKMNGYEVMGRLKEYKETRQIPIIIMTAHNIEDEKIKAILPGSVPVVSKTEGFDKLMILVNKLV